MEYFPHSTSFFSTKFYGRLLFLFCAYLVSAKIGLSLVPPHGFAPLFWPPAAVAITALFFWGYKIWPAITLGTICIYLLTGDTFLSTLGIGIGNTVEALLGVYLLREVVRLNPLFKRVRDAIGLIITGGVISMVGASFGVVSTIVGNSVESANIPQMWLAWWLGDVLSIIILAPFLIRWLWKPFYQRTPRQWIEEIAAFVILIVANVLAFFNSFTQIQMVSLAYIFTPLLWISLRLSPRGLTLANLVTASFAILSILAGYGPFAYPDINGNFFGGQVFIAIVASVFFIFNSSVEARKEVEFSLAAHVATLEHMVERISSEDRAKTDFLAILAHELRNPLSPIVSAIELIKLNGVLPVNVTLFETIDSQIKTMKRLLDDLLDISRITHKKFKIQKEKIVLQSVLNHSVETVRPFITEHEHELSISLPADPVWLEGDPTRLTQVFVNLLYNAAKYTKPGGKIWITCRQERNQKDIINVVIRDTGIGIESHMLARIFDPFVQVNDSSDSSSGVSTGLGIGLSLTRRLVELHKGKVTVSSPGRGQGSTFMVTLPILDKVQLKMEIPDSKVQSLPKESITVSPNLGDALDILLVDDNEPAVQSLQKLLEHNGHKVHSVFTGTAAIEYVKGKHPNVIVLDIGLPDMSGYAVAERLREELHTPFLLIALSGYGQREDKTKSLKAGFNYHLTKPVQVDEVEMLLKKCKHH